MYNRKVGLYEFEVDPRLHMPPAEAWYGMYRYVGYAPVGASIGQVTNGQVMYWLNESEVGDTSKGELLGAVPDGAYIGPLAKDVTDTSSLEEAWLNRMFRLPYGADKPTQVNASIEDYNEELKWVSHEYQGVTYSIKGTFAYSYELHDGLTKCVGVSLIGSVYATNDAGKAFLHAVSFYLPVHDKAPTLNDLLDQAVVKFLSSVDMEE